MNYQKYLEEFKSNLVSRNFSDRTVYNYAIDNKKFFLFLEKHYPSVKSISHITKDMIFDYNNYLTCFRQKDGRPLKSKTVGYKLTALKRMFQYFMKRDYIIKNPASCIDLPREEKSLPRNILTEEEVMTILHSVKLDSPVNIRNRAILELFYSSGLRTFEMAALKIGDIDLKEQTVFIYKGKGSKSRVVPMTQHACEYIRLYIEKARQYMLKDKKEDSGHLFLTTVGKPFEQRTLNKNVIRRVMKNVDIDKHVTCYTFRHTLATHMVKNKVDIRHVSELLGHSNLTTTQKYCHVNIADLKKMHSLYHPREVGDQAAGENN